ncbi:MAG: TerB family tellurite resistance protein [Candidatus Krumholzibacteriota bacterium]
MFESLSRFFQDTMAPAEDKAEDLNHLQVATCALLLEVAHADQDFSEDEEKAIADLVGRRFGLDSDQTAELLHAADSERQKSGDLYQFARLINDSFSRPRKLAVLELLWQVVYSDGVLEAREDALMHKMGTLLGVRHEELMALKLKVKRSGS